MWSLSDRSSLRTGGRFVLFMKPIRQIITDYLQAPRLIQHQTEVYLAWCRRHHGWDLSSDSRWIKTFIDLTGIEDVEDIDDGCMALFEKHLKENYATQYHHKSGMTCIGRFIRFYTARNKVFTKSPRHVQVKCSTYPQIPGLQE